MTLRAQPEYAALAESLRALAREAPLICLDNPGNWGDAVIAAGQRAFFAHYRIPVRHLRLRWPHLHLPAWSRLAARSMRPVIVYTGNGALCGQYPLLMREIRLALAGTGRCVIMPSTYSAASMRMLRPRAGYQFWARDRTESLHHAPGARFCHDMAFFLNLPTGEPTARRGLFFRTDVESTGRAPPPGNRDISAEGTETTPIAPLLRAVGRFEEVHTDRLHVAIIAALLGRKTRLHANNYHKNAAIFESSLAPFYPHVRFHAA